MQIDVAQLELSLSSLYSSAPFIASLLAGILTFLSPCILPLIPPYMSYISGVCIADMNDKKYKFHIILTSLLFIAGFCFVFIIAGLFISSYIGEILSSSYFRYFSAFIIILFGIYFLLPLKLKAKFRFLNLTFTPNLKHNAFGFFSPFVLGMGFSIGWSPCVGPILASILSLSIQSPNIALYLMLSYCIGLGLCFLLVAIFISIALDFLKKLNAFVSLIEIFSGIFLLCIGILILLNKTDFLLW